MTKKPSKGYSELSTSEFTAYRNADNMKANGYDAHVEEVTIKDDKGNPKKTFRVVNTYSTRFWVTALK